jgi:hypothetical protein
MMSFPWSDQLLLIHLLIQLDQLLHHALASFPINFFLSWRFVVV